jgi:hypothetical protein
LSLFISYEEANKTTRPTHYDNNKLKLNQKKFIGKSTLININLKEKKFSKEKFTVVRYSCPFYNKSRALFSLIWSFDRKKLRNVFLCSKTVVSISVSLNFPKLTKSKLR